MSFPVRLINELFLRNRDPAISKTIGLSVSAIADLQVTEGQTLQTGDTIADRALDLKRLEAQAQVEKSKADVDRIIQQWQTPTKCCII